MKDEGVATNDLYAFAKPRLAEIQLSKNVHFTGEGYKQLAGQVAASIEKALAK
jgi:acyl-CoA thioesterase-1